MAPHLIGFDIPGDDGRHWRAYVSPLLLRLQTPYNLDSDSQRGDDLPYSFPSFPRQEQLISDQIQVREVPPGPDTGPKNSNRSKAPHQRPLEHRVGPDLPLDIGGLLAVMHGHADGPLLRSEVKGGNSISGRGTHF